MITVATFIAATPAEEGTEQVNPGDAEPEQTEA
jgi:hypothetical protein